MTIEIHDPEIERIVNDGVLSGRYGSPRDFVTRAVSAWCEQQQPMTAASPSAPAKTLIEFFREFPLVGLELEFERHEVDRGGDGSDGDRSDAV